MKQAIHVELTVETDVLRVTVVNKSEQDLRLWDRNNFWGWSIFSLLLALPGSDEWRKLTAKPIRWTANIPHTLDLPAGGRLDYELRHQNPSWEGLDEVNAWLSRPLQVRVRLRIPETPKALAQGVFIGEALSSSSLSMPPHAWLTGRVG